MPNTGARTERNAANQTTKPMKTMFIRHQFLLLCLGACVALTSIRAADNEPAKEPADDEAAFFKKFQWVKGPAKAGIGSIAEIQVPAGYMFTGSKGAQAILQASGNPTSGNELGFLAPTSMVWSVIFEFDDVGFVKDDDKDKLDADKLLKSITKDNEEANKQREKMGATPIHVTGWQLPPNYNPETHNLEWAIKGESEGHTIVNYNVRLLGRKGVMSAVLLVSPEKMGDTLPAYQAMLKDYSFKDGERYAEYRQGDKLAKYGLAALVVGGAAVGAAKLGLFAWLAVLLKKGWKVIVVGFAAVAAWFKKLISGGRRNQQQP